MTQRIFITGGASGLGKALALRWAKDGARVCIADLNDERGAETLKEIQQAGGEGFYCHCDVTDLEQIKQAKDFVLEHLGGVDVVVNNAGVASAGALEIEDMEQWRWVLDINVLGVVRVSQVFMDLFRQQGQGYFLNVASQAGLNSAPMMGSYCAGKAAVVSFSETMYLELAPENVGVSVLCPAFFKTNLDESLRSKQPGMDAAVKKLLNRSSVTAEDVANAAVQGVRSRKFLILTHKEGIQAYMLKCYLPMQKYLKMMLKRTAKFGRKG